MGYQPVSAAMRELAAAEQAYQRARSSRRALAAQESDLGVTDRDRTAVTSASRWEAVEIDIDLREAGQSWPGRMAPPGERVCWASR